MSSINKDDAPKECLYLKVLAENERTSNVQFKIKKNMLLTKLMEAYCERTGLAVGTVKFLFNNHTITDFDTSVSLKMENEDTIKVLKPKTIVCQLCAQRSCLELRPNDSSFILLE
ncbi:small ubiquitin-related modifier 3-like isoform X2 [Metopolophium dirhodum]|uniref:small ubiquitin-related modifier 3-like isoform X2 n=1 Tax=Metopolophium dirhodum TaxID=44670 RepID=UPI00299041E8|nr:small ubiquitin-related modifier 3-like isoform X2 [Metopolophium dirhodum]